MDGLIQTIIVLLGASAIYFLSRKEKLKRWGFILGLIAEPFCAYSYITHGQYGILLLTLFYTFSYCQGIYNYWIKKEKNI